MGQVFPDHFSGKSGIAHFTEIVYGFKTRVAVHKGHYLTFGTAANFNWMIITVLGFDGNVVEVIAEFELQN